MVDIHRNTPYTECDCGQCPNQWIFLGASVISFDSNAGYGAESSSMSVKLVVDSDECERTKYYLNQDLVATATTAPDPGFLGDSGDIIGIPVMFKFEDFEYCGLVQSYQKDSNVSGRNIITVNLISPAEVLEGISIILDKYRGESYSVPNLINVYGYLEDRDNCSDFGGSDVVNRGMPWHKFYGAFSVLTSQIPYVASPYSNGRCTFVAGLNSGLGCIPEDEIGYLIDLSELNILTEPDYRIPGTSMNLLDIVNQVTSDMGLDYFIDLIPVTHLSNVRKVIKIRIVDRTIQPALGTIAQFVSEAQLNGCDVISKTTGRELRNEKTNTFVIGPNRLQMFWINQDEISGDQESLNDYSITPYWGRFSETGLAIPTTVIDDVFHFQIDLTDIVSELNLITFESPIQYTNEIELSLVAVGYDVWKDELDPGLSELAYNIQLAKTANDIVADDGIKSTTQLEGLLTDEQKFSVLRGMHFWNFRTRHDTTLGEFVEEELDHDLRIIYSKMEDVLNRYYGKQYLVKIPELCVYIDEYGDKRFSRLISDGGWNEEDGTEFEDLIGIDTTSEVANFFRLEDGRFRPFVRYDGEQQENSGETYFCLDHLNNDEYGYIFEEDSGEFYRQKVWVKCDTKEEFVFLSGDYELPRAVVELPDMVRPIDCKEADALDRMGGFRRRLGLIMDPEDADQRIRDMTKRIGSTALEDHTDFVYMELPDAVTIALENTESVYGPYYAGTLGVAGKTQIVEDGDLTPWFFGSFANMNTYGQTVADNGVTNMLVGEYGTVVIPGWPTSKLGDELLGSGGYIAGQNNFITRTMDSNVFDGTQYYLVNLLTVGYWDGSYGPSITNISVSVADSITTTYNLRTYTKQFGRASKSNLDKFKEFSKMKQTMFRNYLSRKYNGFN